MASAPPDPPSPITTETVGYYPGMYDVADGPDALRAAARRQLAHGADLIKVLASAGVLSEEESVGAPQYSQEELNALVEEGYVDQVQGQVDRRQRLLYEGKAVPLKEVQQAEGALAAAENDRRSAEVALEAARSRLRILGKTDQEIAEFEEKGTINPATPIFAKP